jgi:tetratricopeptide (TPR) repeat protein
MSKTLIIASVFAALVTGLAAQEQSRVGNDQDAREQIDLLARLSGHQCREASDKAAEILRKHPDDFLALTSILGCIDQLNSPEMSYNSLKLAYLDEAQAASLYLLENVDRIFADGNHPPMIPVDLFRKLKEPAEVFARRTLAHVYLEKKDPAKAVAELRKALEIDPTQAQLVYDLGTALLGQQTVGSNSTFLALFYYARAAVYEGPNALPPEKRKATLEFVRRAYRSYHGSDKGIDQLLEMARWFASPPEDFRIDSCCINYGSRPSEPAAK